jgi:hypothetical protein
MSSNLRKSATIIGVTFSSAWLSAILYTYYSTQKYKNKYTNEFDTFYFSLEGFRNSFLIGGAIGLISGSIMNM